MGWTVTPGEATPGGCRAQPSATRGAAGLRGWTNGPGDRYGTHAHDRPKVLFCLEGSIVFHTDDGDVSLTAGDRLDLEAGTAHGATVGPDGCACIEAWGL